MNLKMIEVNEQLNDVVRGKNDIIKKVLAAILAGGHILLDDIPGVGKTTLALSISKIMDLDYKRVQFTPDILPSDITGFSMYNNKTGEFEYRAGAAMTNLFLADEINRTSPKTQSALLEIMEEGRVTVDGTTYPLPDPFIVIATENPLGSSGTQMLPESQLDRFMICLSLGYPCHTDAIDILKNNTASQLKNLASIFSKNELKAARAEVENIFVHDTIFDYIITLTEKTRDNDYFTLGASPRASVSLLKIAKAVAYLAGRNFVTPADVMYVLNDVFGHRVVLSSKGKSLYRTSSDALNDMAKSVPVPAMNSFH